MNIALNYGAREELCQAFSKMSEDILNGKILQENITPSEVSKYLYTANQPDPDLIIRTSGEERLSNFMLWQAAYSELWFTKKFWPDFNKGDLYRALFDFQQRTRRFGGV